MYTTNIKPSMRRWQCTVHNTVSFTALSDQVLVRYLCLSFQNLIILIYGFSIKLTCAFLVQENISEVSGKVFKDIVVNRTFPSLH